MNIDRHNYEEFFILYLDNELPRNERLQVEAFVQQHPDLKEELELLQQFKLEPDTSVFYSGKEELMRVNGESPVSLANAQEWMILYHDNELSESQRKDVIQLISENPSLQQEFSLLQKSKLAPDSIIFSDKASLYRHEEKVRAIPVRWWRAAAAILILALGIGGYLLSTSKSTNTIPGAVAETPGGKKSLQSPAPEIPQSTNELAITEGVKKEHEELAQQTPVKYPESNTRKIKDPSANSVISPSPEEKQFVAEVKNKPSNNLPQPENNPYQPSRNENNAIAQLPIKEKVKTNSLIADPVTTDSPDPSDIHTAALTIQDPVDENSGKKNKLRGFFRKITRTLEKRTNIDPTDDDEKLLVGGLAIKLK